MNKRRKFTMMAMLGVLVTAIGGCSDRDESTHSQASTSGTALELSAPQTSSARPTLTEPRLQPPTQENEEGRSEVVFDPCTWISDTAVRKAGLDPATRRRGDDTVAEYTFLTCDFKGPLRDLQINSGNVSWEEDLQKNTAHSEPIAVNGREALLVQDPQVQRVCSIHVRTEVGFVMFSSARTFEGSEAGLARCDGVLEIATALEPEIGEGN